MPLMQQKKPPIAIPFFALTAILLLQWPASYLIQNFSITAGTLLYEWLLIAGIPFLLTRYYQIPFAQLFPFKSIGKKPLLYLLLMTLALVVIIDYFLFLSENVFPPPKEIHNLFNYLMQVSSLGEGLWRWFLICVTPAICEEIFFRGFFQNSLGQYWRKTSALIFTAVAFALIHGIPWYWHLYLILGFYLSWLLFKTGNLWFPILAHFINNSWTFANHALGNKIPIGGIWKGTDTLVFVISLIVFLLAAFRFQEVCPRAD